MFKTFIYSDGLQPMVSVDLLSAAYQIAGPKQNETWLGAFHTDTEQSAPYFDHAVHIKSEGIYPHNIAAQVDCLEKLYHEHEFDCIIFPATFFGRMLAPRLAMRLGVGLVADVTEIGEKDGTPALVRPAFDGKIFATIINAGKPPLMASIRPDVFRYDGDVKKNTKTVEFDPGIEYNKKVIQLLEKVEQPAVTDIRESAVLVSGGGGTKDYFDKLKPLADTLDGMVSASRSIVDSGLATRAIQVGHSGKVVSPALYIALGIYGSVQHIEGLREAEHIITVNTNKNAPIGSLSDIVVEGDAEAFIDMLCERISQTSLNTKE